MTNYAEFYNEENELIAVQVLHRSSAHFLLKHAQQLHASTIFLFKQLELPEALLDYFNHEKRHVYQINIQSNEVELIKKYPSPMPHKSVSSGFFSNVAENLRYAYSRMHTPNKKITKIQL